MDISQLLQIELIMKYLALLSGLLPLTCANCSGTLSVIGNFPETCGYTNDRSIITEGTWRTVFANSDETNCPVTCSLHQGTCGTGTKPSETYFILGDAASEYSLTKTPAMYSSAVCYQCQNSGGVVTTWYQNKIKWSSFTSCTSTPATNICDTVLTGSSYSFPDQSLTLSTGTTTVHADQEWVTNSNSVQCPVTSCSLMYDLDYSNSFESYTGTAVSINPSTTHTFTIDLNQCFSGRFRVDCTNDHQTVSTGYILMEILQSQCDTACQTINAPSITETQSTLTGASDAYFQFPQFTLQGVTQLSLSCSTTITYGISAVPQVWGQAVSGLSSLTPSLFSGNLRVTPQDINLKNTYVFYILVSFDGGTTISYAYPNALTLDILLDCSVIGVTVGSALSYSFTLGGGSQTISKADIDAKITSADSECVPSYELMELIDGTYVTNTNSRLMFNSGFNIVVSQSTISENIVYVKAFNTGSSTIGYLQISVSINCLSETISIGSSLTYSYQQSNAVVQILKSVLDAQVSSSNAMCNFNYILMENFGGSYVANSIGNIAFDNSFNLAITPSKISSNSLFVQAGFENQVSGFWYLPVTIIIDCNQETPTAGSGLSLTFNLSSMAQSTLKSVIDSQFSSATSSICTLNHQLVERVGLTFTPNTLGYISFDTPTNNLVVTPATIFQASLYIQTSYSGSSNYAYLPLSISSNCLTESLTVLTSGLSYSLSLSSIQASIASSDYTSKFKNSNSLCSINYSLMVSSGGAYVANTYSQITLANDILVDISSLNQFNFFVRAGFNDSVNNFAYLQVQISANCLSETITLKESEIILTFYQDTGYKTNIFMDQFENTNLLCNVNYNLKVLEGGQYLNYSKSKNLFISDDHNLIVSTAKLLKNKQVFIEAKFDDSKIGEAYLLVEVSVISQPVDFDLSELINQAPLFLEQIPEIIEFLIEPGVLNQFQYVLPEMADPNNDNFTVNVYDPQQTSFIHFHEENYTLIFKEISGEQQGEYSLIVELKDSFNMARNETFQFLIQKVFWYDVIDDSQNITQIEKNQIQSVSSIEREQINNFSVKIIEINNVGQVFLQFSTIMKTDFDVDELDTSVMDLYISPQNAREDVNISRLNFTWKVSTFEGDSMVIDLYFDDLQYISSSTFHDMLIIFIKNKQEYFISQELLMDLSNNSLLLTSKIPRQMDPDEMLIGPLKYLSENIQGAFTTAFIVSIALNNVFVGILNQFLGSLRHLQLVTHILMLGVITPANVSLLIECLLPITQFDFLEPWLTDSIVTAFDLEEDLYEMFEVNGRVLSDQFKESGYKHHLSILLLGSMGLFYLVYFMRIILLIIIGLLKYITGKGVILYQRLYQRVFFEDLITLSRESYIELLIIGYLTLQYPISMTPTNAEKISSILGYFSGIISCLIVPSIILWIIFIEKSKDFEALTQEYGQQNFVRIRIVCVTWYFVRRILFVRMIFIRPSLVNIQVHSLIFFNTISMVFQGKFKPFIGRKENMIQTFNEFMLHIIFFHLIFFTDLVPDLEAQNLIGWSMNVFIMAMILVNLFQVTQSLARAIFLVGKKYFNRLQQSLLIRRNRNQVVVPTNEIELQQDRLIVTVEPIEQASQHENPDIFQRDPEPENKYQISVYFEDQKEEDSDIDGIFNNTPRFENNLSIPNVDGNSFSFRQELEDQNQEALNEIFEKYGQLFNILQIQSNIDAKLHVMDLVRAGREIADLHPLESKRLQNEEFVCNLLEQYRLQTFEDDPYITNGTFITNLRENFELIVKPSYLKLLFGIDYCISAPALQDDNFVHFNCLEDIPESYFSGLTSIAQQSLIEGLCPRPIQNEDLKFIRELYEKSLTEKQRAMQFKKEVDERYETNQLSPIQVVVKNYVNTKVAKRII